MSRVLIAYDGSASAATAVRAAASLFPGARACVATVASEPTVRAGTAVPPLPSMSPTAVGDAIDELHAAALREADELAEQAVEQARKLGLPAEPVTVRASGPAWAALLGSVSSGLVQNAELPVLVVPEGDG